ncbi:hypothetical protein OG21DRAFT_686266 [Imleria badia]|nr:hypothetical protein OG21DRAFT_686266 [Imleria badia]
MSPSRPSFKSVAENLKSVVRGCGCVETPYSICTGMSPALVGVNVRLSGRFAGLAACIRRDSPRCGDRRCSMPWFLSSGAERVSVKSMARKMRPDKECFIFQERQTSKRRPGLQQTAARGYRLQGFICRISATKSECIEANSDGPLGSSPLKRHLLIVMGDIFENFF